MHYASRTCRANDNRMRACMMCVHSTRGIDHCVMSVRVGIHTWLSINDIIVPLALAIRFVILRRTSHGSICSRIRNHRRRRNRIRNGCRRRRRCRGRNRTHVLEHMMCSIIA